MRSDTLKRHMLKHREFHTLDEDEIRDEIKRRKKLLETKEDQFLRQISVEDGLQPEHGVIETSDTLNPISIEKQLMSVNLIYMRKIERGKIIADVLEKGSVREDSLSKDNREVLKLYRKQMSSDSLSKHVYSTNKTPPAVLKPISIENDTRDDDRIYTEFQFESFITGYFHYQFIWTPQIGEVLTTTCESDNTYDKFAISILKNNDTIVGHTPRQISKQFTALLKSKGTVNVKVLRVLLLQ